MSAQKYLVAGGSSALIVQGRLQTFPFSSAQWDRHGSVQMAFITGHAVCTLGDIRFRVSDGSSSCLELPRPHPPGFVIVPHEAESSKSPWGEWMSIRGDTLVR